MRMKAFDTDALCAFVLLRLDPKQYRRVAELLPALIADFARYDRHFMRLGGVLTPGDEWGKAEYDEDDAFEYIYDAYLSDHPDDDDDDMAVAAALNRYMELKHDFLEEQE